MQGTSLRQNVARPKTLFIPIFLPTGGVQKKSLFQAPKDLIILRFGVKVDGGDFRFNLVQAVDPDSGSVTGINSLTTYTLNDMTYFVPDGTAFVPANRIVHIRDMDNVLDNCLRLDLEFEVG